MYHINCVSHRIPTNVPYSLCVVSWWFCMSKLTISAISPCRGQCSTQRLVSFIFKTRHNSPLRGGLTMVPIIISSKKKMPRDIDSALLYICLSPVSVACGEDPSSAMQVTYKGQAYKVYPVDVSPNDCSALEIEPFTFVLENVNTERCGIRVIGIS